jgi:C1A family cysteine protease
MVTKGFGWKRGLPDIRDYKLNFRPAEIELAPEVDLRTTGLLPDIWDQGQLGSCTAHGVSAAYSYDLEKQYQGDNFLPSRLYVYYNTRLIEGTTNEDSGAYIKDAVKSLNLYGAPPETDWAYDIAQFAIKPAQKAYDDGALHEAIKYARVNQTVYDMKACLTEGTPFVIGFTVYDSFESDDVSRTGDVPMPGTTESVLGGHCVLIVGYTVRNDKNVWIARNSWGTGWGDQGYFYFPEEYLTNNLSDDFWDPISILADPTPILATASTPVPQDHILSRSVLLRDTSE